MKLDGMLVEKKELTSKAQNTNLDVAKSSSFL